MKGEASCIPFVDIDPQHVGRQQIAGELDALKFNAHEAREQMGESGLADPRQVFNEQMATRQQASECETNLAGFAEYHLFGSFDDGLQAGTHDLASGSGAQARFGDVFDGAL